MMIGYEIVEHFISINGEGPLAGQLALFIRFKGCNLACEYCDTKWANERNAKCTIMTAEAIYTMIKDAGVRNVTLTGGEPLSRSFIYELVEFLCYDEDLHIEIETNGSIPLEPFTCIEHAPSFTMDYKLSCSGMEEKMCLENFDLLREKDTVKFVVGSIADLNRACEIIRTYDLTHKCHVYLSPAFGLIDPKDIVNYMIMNRLNDINLQIQMHKVIWDPDKRGV